MVRTDTAGFWKYMNFYGHKKPGIIPIPDDPTTPVSPCSKCPEWYTCTKGVCTPPAPNPWESKKPDILNSRPYNDKYAEIIYTPTPVDNLCTMMYELKPDNVWWLKILSNWFITWATDNSWVRFYLSWWQGCWSKVTFEWRISEIDSTWYNRIEYWFWDINSKNIAISNISSFDAKDPNDRFRITLKNNWDYLIEVQRVISSSEMYDWTTYKSWNCLEKWSWWALDYSVPMWMIYWVNGKALLTTATNVKDATDNTQVMYTSERWTIVWNKTRQEIILTKDNWESISILDKDIWWTINSWGQWVSWNVFQWWNNYPFPKSGNYPEKISKELVDTTGYSCSNPYSSDTFITSDSDPTTPWLQANRNWSSIDNPNLWWESQCQWPCPSGFHVPSMEDALKLLDTYAYIVWIDRTNMSSSEIDSFEYNLKIPGNTNYRRWTWQLSGWSGLIRYWTSTSATNYAWQEIVHNDSAYVIYITSSWMVVYPYEWWWTQQNAYWKNYWFPIRPFKNTTS